MLVDSTSLIRFTLVTRTVTVQLSPGVTIKFCSVTSKSTMTENEFLLCSPDQDIFMNQIKTITSKQKSKSLQQHFCLMVYCATFYSQHSPITIFMDKCSDDIRSAAIKVRIRKRIWVRAHGVYTSRLRVLHLNVIHPSIIHKIVYWYQSVSKNFLCKKLKHF